MSCNFLKLKPDQFTCECAGETSIGEIVMKKGVRIVGTVLEYELVKCGNEFAIAKTYHPMFSPPGFETTEIEYQYSNEAEAVAAFHEVTLSSPVIKFPYF